EIWIFDAQNLQQGALYKLSHPKLNFGFTVHTTWLKEAVSPSPRKYNIREDYDYLIDGQPPELRERIRQLFEEEIYPNFE
ncbi:MAG: carotenoid oxygenase family protein, partial [Xenococcaceae cyanobacterium]